jgi:transcriptional regulator with XRE-family HTH domain
MFIINSFRGGNVKNTKELLGGRIRELRKGLKMSQESLSEKIDVDPRYVSRIELGKCFPSLETLENISRALNVEMRDLFDYRHLSESLNYEDEIKNLVGLGNSEQKELILRITRTVTRSVLNGL